MLRDIKKFGSTILGYSKFIIIVVGFLILLALISKLGLEIVGAVVGVLKKYWYITILLAVIIIYFTTKSNDKK